MHDTLLILAGSQPDEVMARAIADNIELFVIFGTGGLIALIAITFGTVTGLAKSKAREQTKRELAAYVAEGSMGAEEAERILKAQPKHI